MIEIMAMYISTLVATLGINVYQEMQIRKFLADNCYRLKNNEDCLVELEISSDLRFIPFVNMALATINYRDFIEGKENIIQEFKEMDIIEKMSIYEEQEYKKNPSLLNACSLDRKRMKKRYNSRYIDYEDNKIFFQINDNLELNIVDSTGTISRYNDDNQKYILVSKLEDQIIKREKELSEEQLINEIEELESSKKYLQEYRDNLEKNKIISTVLIKSLKK